MTPIAGISMSRLTRTLFFATGFVSIIVLGIAIFYHPSQDIESIPVNESPAAEELEYFMTDNLNYDLDFSKILIEKRIEHIERIARENPALEPRAREVIDTLKSRLKWKARF